MSYLSYSAYILDILYIVLLKWMNNELIVYELPIQGLLIQNHLVASWLAQSKEYQELLGPQWLIVNCLLKMTLQGWGI